MRFGILLVVSSLCLGCAKKPQDEPSNRQGTPRAGDAPVVADEPSKAPEGLLDCKVDTDCALTGRSFEGEDACCVMCSADRAVNAEVLDTFGAQCKAKRSQSTCPKGDCAMPPPTLARCIDSKCTAVKGPRMMRTCEADSDCALAGIGFVGDETCCAGCGDEAVNKASLTELQAWCEQNPTTHICPEAECEPHNLVAKCVNKLCVAQQ